MEYSKWNRHILTMSWYDGQHRFNTYKNVLDYSRKEKDLRGFVEVTGWAHSTAHTADVLGSLSKSEYLKAEELKEILRLIKEKICVKSYTYVNEEDERLVSAFRWIYDRKLISTEEYVEWIYTFKDVQKEEVPFEQRLRENRKIF